MQRTISRLYKYIKNRIIFKYMYCSFFILYCETLTTTEQHQHDHAIFTMYFFYFIFVVSSFLYCCPLSYSSTIFLRENVFTVQEKQHTKYIKKNLSQNTTKKKYLYKKLHMYNHMRKSSQKKNQIRIFENSEIIIFSIFLFFFSLVFFDKSENTEF